MCNAYVITNLLVDGTPDMIHHLGSSCNECVIGRVYIIPVAASLSEILNYISYNVGYRMSQYLWPSTLRFYMAT